MDFHPGKARNETHLFLVEGTFTKPMPTGEGKTIAPTGKAYQLGMATIGHWNKQGVLVEEYSK